MIFPQPMLIDELTKFNTLLRDYRAKFSFSKWSEAEREEVKNSITYHSNKIEGLALSYGETIDFLKHQTIRKGASIKDLADVKNHRSILDNIFLSFESVQLSENNIKDLHRELMHYPDQWTDPDWLEHNPGEYKNSFNGTYRSNGSYHEYMSPWDVSKAMSNLLTKTNFQLAASDLNNTKAHPVTTIALFHYVFLNEIHPFWDGNGRVCRIVTNLLLLQRDLPLLNITETEKKAYHQSFVDSEKSADRLPIIIFISNSLCDFMERRMNG
jgi:Fic family protein